MPKFWTKNLNLITFFFYNVHALAFWACFHKKYENVSDVYVFPNIFNTENSSPTNNDVCQIWSFCTKLDRCIIYLNKINLYTLGVPFDLGLWASTP